MLSVLPFAIMVLQQVRIPRKNRVMATVTIVGSGVVVEKTFHNLLIVA